VKGKQISAEEHSQWTVLHTDNVDASGGNYTLSSKSPEQREPPTSWTDVGERGRGAELKTSFQMNLPVHCSILPTGMILGNGFADPGKNMPRTPSPTHAKGPFSKLPAQRLILEEENFEDPCKDMARSPLPRLNTRSPSPRFGGARMNNNSVSKELQPVSTRVVSSQLNTPWVEEAARVEEAAMTQELDIMMTNSIDAVDLSPPRVAPSNVAVINSDMTSSLLHPEVMFAVRQHPHPRSSPLRVAREVVPLQNNPEQISPWTALTSPIAPRVDVDDATMELEIL
jgi:hypothetical protein